MTNIFTNISNQRIIAKVSLRKVEIILSFPALVEGVIIYLINPFKPKASDTPAGERLAKYSSWSLNLLLNLIFCNPFFLYPDTKG